MARPRSGKMIRQTPRLDHTCNAGEETSNIWSELDVYDIWQCNCTQKWLLIKIIRGYQREIVYTHWIEHEDKR